VLLREWAGGLERKGRIVIPVAGAVTIALPAYFALIYQGWESAYPSDLFISITARQGYTLLSADHILDVLNEMLLVAPAGLVLLWPSIGGWKTLYASFRRRFWFLTLLVLPSLFFVLMIDPKLGFARDWDLFATSTAVPAVAVLLARIARSDSLRAIEKTGVFLALAFLSSFVVVNMGKNSSVERFYYLLGVDVEMSALGREVLSDYYESKGELDSAIHQLYLALKVEDNKRHRNLLATMLYDVGQYESSAKEALRATRLDPDFGPAHYQLGKTHEKLGNPGSALRSYRKAVSLEPDVAHYRNSLGVLLLGTGNYAEADSMFAVAVKLKPDNVVYIANLGSAKMALSKLPEARMCFEQALRIDSRFDLPMFNLARIYAAMGMNDRAREYYRMFLEHSSDPSLVRQAEVLLDSLR
jgi:Flp pilus assembly protein TadD